MNFENTYPHPEKKSGTPGKGLIRMHADMDSLTFDVDGSSCLRCVFFTASAELAVGIYGSG